MDYFSTSQFATVTLEMGLLSFKGSHNFSNNNRALNSDALNRAKFNTVDISAHMVINSLPYK